MKKNISTFIVFEPYNVNEWYNIQKYTQSISFVTTVHKRKEILELFHQ